MTKEGQFLIYCIEIYKTAKQMTGKEVVSCFYKYGVGDYIRSFYEAMHTTGEKYIVNDIDLFIQARSL